MEKEAVAAAAAAAAAAACAGSDFPMQTCLSGNWSDFSRHAACVNWAHLDQTFKNL